VEKGGEFNRKDDKDRKERGRPARFLCIAARLSVKFSFAEKILAQLHVYLPSFFAIFVVK
jgi:hypothetical protein